MVFGRVTKGMNVVDKIAECGSHDGKPRKIVTISKCGVL